VPLDVRVWFRPSALSRDMGGEASPAHMRRKRSGGDKAEPGRCPRRATPRGTHRCPSRRLPPRLSRSARAAPRFGPPSRSPRRSTGVASGLHSRGGGHHANPTQRATRIHDASRQGDPAAVGDQAAPAHAARARSSLVDRSPGGHARGGVRLRSSASPDRRPGARTPTVRRPPCATPIPARSTGGWLLTV
jgi:hypothetical protein